MWDRNPKSGVWIHFGAAECHILLLGHIDPGLGFRKIEEKVCPELSNNFPTNALQSSRNCEISCLLKTIIGLA